MATGVAAGVACKIGVDWRDPDGFTMAKNDILLHIAI